MFTTRWLVTDRQTEGVYVCVCTSATLSSSGSSQCSLHSQCESRKVRTGAVAASAPRTLERIKPEGHRG